jgi:hypothetical protein
MIRQFWRKFFKQQSATPKPEAEMEEAKKEDSKDMDSIFYHEDDYCQVELVPIENFDALIRQAQNVQDFSEKHVDGGAYTDMYIRDSHGLHLKERGIPLAALDKLLSMLSMKRFIHVSTGIRPGEMDKGNTFGYGENYHGIFFDFASDVVNNIWIAGSPQADAAKISQVFHQIGQTWNLLLMDWNSLELIELKNKEQTQKYFYKLVR